MEKEILQELGLTRNEVEIYLTLLRTGSISVNTIAEKSGLHRQAVYDALERLLEKGFVSYVIKNSKKYFQGVVPEKIGEYLKEKEQRFLSILPNLVSLTKLPREDTFVELYKGKDVVRRVYSDIIKSFQKKRGEILISGVNERLFMKEDRIALKQHLVRLRELECTERILVEEGDRHFVEGPQTIYRWTPRESFIPTPIFVYNDKLASIILGNPNYAIIITNKSLADAYQKQFDLLWKVAKKP